MNVGTQAAAATSWTFTSRRTNASVDTWRGHFGATAAARWILAQFHVLAGSHRRLRTRTTIVAIDLGMVGVGITEPVVAIPIGFWILVLLTEPRRDTNPGEQQ